MEVFTKQKKCYVFDFDDTLVKTYALVYVKKDERIIKAIKSSEYAEYKLQERESFDYTEFLDPYFIFTGYEMPLFKMLHNINKSIYEGRSDSCVYILTARESVLRDVLYEYFTDRGITCIPKNQILTVGDDKSKSVSESKKEILEELMKNGYDLTFFDDDTKNIEIAKSISGIKTRHMRDDDI